MAGRGSETGSGNEAHRAPGESGQAEGAGYEHPDIDQAKGASGDDLDRMEEKLEHADPAHPRRAEPRRPRQDRTGTSLKADHPGAERA